MEDMRRFSPGITGSVCPLGIQGLFLIPSANLEIYQVITLYNYRAQTKTPRYSLRHESVFVVWLVGSRVAVSALATTEKSDHKVIVESELLSWIQ